VLREGLRPHDLSGRYGGEEFVVVLPDCDEPDALRILERIREQLPVTLLKADCPTFTVSFGLASSKPGQTFETLVATADAALLEAKQQGRNRVIVANHDAPTPVAAS
jgi:diguanylate cyclase (GGDEF)-like protein